jgi:HNH endonuclease
VTKRNEFSEATIRDRLEHCGWQCEHKLEDGKRCCAPVQKGRFVADHHLPDRMGGKNTFENCRILCIQCNAIKTAIDQGKIGHQRRVEKKDLRAKQATDIGPKIKSRGFDKSVREKRGVDKSSLAPLARIDIFTGRPIE